MSHPLSLAAIELLAYHAHQGQVNEKSGEPFYHHPARVAASLTDETAKKVAWLHDSIEDCAGEMVLLPRKLVGKRVMIDAVREGITADILRRAGVETEVVAAVVAMTHLENEPYDVYLERVRQNPLALEVKHADIRDNLDPARLALLDEATQARLRRKYTRALAILDRPGAAPVDEATPAAASVPVASLAFDGQNID